MKLCLVVRQDKYDTIQLLNLIFLTMETNKQQQLEQLLRIQQSNQLSSEQEPSKEEPFRKSQYRKPLKNAFSDNEDQSDSSIQPQKIGKTPLPPKPVKQKSVIQQAQQEIKWTREDTSEIDLLSKLDGNGMKDKKIRELALKIKSLNIAYEKQKTIRRNLETQLNSTLKANMQAKKTKEQSQSMQKTMGNKSEKQKQKCSNCSEQQKKIMDFRLKYQNLKTQLNKAHRLITREIGQNFDIDQALSQQNSWKGRQQKIQKLKGRVKQLQQKLANNGVNVSHMSGFTQVSAPPTKNSSFTATQRTSTLADNKRKELQNLKVQVEALRTQNDLLQSKVKSLNSRKINLQTQLKDLKADFQKKKQIFLQKSQNDDRFIALLKQENQKLKKEQKVVTKVVYKDAKQNTQQVNLLKKQVENLKKKLKQSQKQKEQLQAQQQQVKQQKVVKAVNEVRQISTEKRKQLEQEYIKGAKYLKKFTAQDQQQIYKAWKQSKGKF